MTGVEDGANERAGSDGVSPASTTERGTDVLRRRQVLAACDDAALVRRQLVEATDCSRTTAYRATVDLVERGWLERTADGYRTTDRGGALLGAADAFLESVDAIDDRLQPLFDAIAAPELREHAHLLNDATVTTVDASNPYRVVERAIERFDAVDNARGVSSSVNDAEALEQAVSMIDQIESIEWIFAESALDAHETIADDQFFAAIDRPHVSLAVAPDDAIPFSFSVDDDDVSITGHDANTGLPTVLVESGALTARAWLDERFEAISAEATPICEWIDAE